MNILDSLAVVRSKNSGPYELTFDIIFKEDKYYNNFLEKNHNIEEIFIKSYGIKKEEILSIINYYQARAIKITIKRPIASGSLGERDVYGAQQHMPLLNALENIII